MRQLLGFALILGIAAAVQVSGTPELVPGGPDVEILDLGAESRRVLQYSPRVGTKTRIVTKFEFNGSVTSGGQASDQSLPPITVHVRGHVVDAGPKGAVVEHSVVRLEVDGVKKAAAARARKEFQRLVGLRYSMRLSPDGVPEQLSTEQSIDQELVDTWQTLNTALQVEDHYVRFPRKPVGVGARWRYQTIHHDTVYGRVPASCTYTLKAVDGSRVVVDYQRVMTVDHKTIEQPDSSSAMVTYSRRVAGTIEVQLDTGIPKTVKSTSKTTAQRPSSQGATVRLHSSVDTETRGILTPGGRGHVILFTATWSGPCKMAWPHLVESLLDAEEHGMEVCVVLAQGTMKPPRELDGLPTAVDERGELMEHLAVKGIPTVIVTDSSGAIAWQGTPARQGQRGMSYDQLGELIRRVSDGRAQTTEAARLPDNWRDMLARPQR